MVHSLLSLEDQQAVSPRLHLFSLLPSYSASPVYLQRFWVGIPAFFSEGSKSLLSGFSGTDLPVHRLLSLCGSSLRVKAAATSSNTSVGTSNWKNCLYNLTCKYLLCRDYKWPLTMQILIKTILWGHSQVIKFECKTLAETCTENWAKLFYFSKQISPSYMVNSPSHSVESILENCDCRFLSAKTLVVATVISQNVIYDFFIPMNLFSFVLLVQKETNSRAYIFGYGKLIAEQMPAKDFFFLYSPSAVTER